MRHEQTVEHSDVLIIGGGQAGLSMGYHLKQRGVRFRILDASQRTGDVWRNRWDSLRLFTPARYAALDGMRVPADPSAYVTKDQMADYLEAYARRFELPIETGVRVDSLSRVDGKFVATAGERRFEADQVVVAMANYQVPRVPPFARQLDPEIVQLHSTAYRNPGQLREGGVLVVGVGNSGADIALEVSRTHLTWLAGKESGFIPFPIDTWFSRHVALHIVRFIGHHVLTLDTKKGRALRAKALHAAAPLVRVKPKDLVRAGVERVSRVTGIRDGRPVLEDGRRLDVANVIWCTGFDSGFSWVELPIFDAHGDPRHERGVVKEAPGLYFVGLHFLYAMTSATLTGVGRDASRIADAVVAYAPSRESLPVRGIAHGRRSAEIILPVGSV